LHGFPRFASYITQLPAHFQRNLRAAASWLFFLRRGGSACMNPDMGASLVPLKIRRGGTCGDITIICETVH
jgi:hypothetical protein